MTKIPRAKRALRALFGRKKSGKSGSASDAKSSAEASRSVSVESGSDMEEELRHVFNKFDANGDGKISSSELDSMLSSLGYKASPEELQEMIREVDADGDGHIDLREFIELNTMEIDADEALESLKEAFSVFDIDKNGSISAEELQNVLRSIGEECSIAECRKMISGVDSDGDGSVSFEEFKRMMVKGSRFDALDPQRISSVKID
ncbi:hypothetical protein NMG60_11023703 [Bertholletia excelsa]